MMRFASLIILACLAQVVYGQELLETRVATLSDGDYALKGTVHLERYDDESLKLRFGDDYKTQSNVFDVHVFLTNKTDYSAPIDTTGMLLVENIGTIDGINYSSGAMTFSLPSGKGIDDYKHIVFICMQFGRLHWGSGTFSKPVVTSTSEPIEPSTLSLSVFPNPSATGIIEARFESASQSALLEVFNSQGQLVLSQQVTNGQPSLIDLKVAGVYFLELSSGQSAAVQRVIRY